MHQSWLQGMIYPCIQKHVPLVLHCLFQEGDADIRMQLSEEDKQLCAQVVKHYLSGKVSDPVSAGG